MRSTSQYIRKELEGLYPTREIESFMRLIIESVCGWNFTQQLVNRNETIGKLEKDRIIEIVTRLKKFEPVQYILLETFFAGLKFRVNPAVLIPRPETEELVQLIVQDQKSKGARILDIGTGSGCIAVAIKSRIQDSEVMGIDISQLALETARQNAILNQTEVQFIQADILKWDDLNLGRFDIIVSNPPYVCECEREQMGKNVLDYEPASALFVPDNDPLIFYRAISDYAMKNLNYSGKLYLEINASFGNDIKLMFEKSGFPEVEIHHDLNGKDRMVSCIRY